MKKKEKLLFPVVCILLFGLGLETGGFQLSVLQMAKEFQISSASMGLMIGAQYGAIMLMPLIFGKRSDRWGKKYVILGAMLVFLAGCLLIVAAPGYGLVLAGIFVLGSGYSVCESTATAVLTDQFAKKAGGYISLTQSCFSLGAVAGPLLVDYGIRRFGMDWRLTFWMAAGLYACMLVPMLCTQVRPLQLSAGTPSGKEGHRFRPDLVMGCLIFAMVIYVGIENGTGYFADTFLELDLQITGKASGVIAAFWSAMILSRIVSGILYRLKRRLLLICYTGSMLLLGGLYFVSDLHVVTVMFFLMGLFYGPVWPALMGIAAEEYPERTGAVTGLMASACGAGGALFPVLMGWALNMFGVRASYLMMAGMAGLAIAAILRLYIHLNGKSAGRKRGNRHVPSEK